jgi:very-short-patch-repair endonuclease
MSRMGVGKACARLMASQSGVISRSQAIELAATPSFIRTRVDRGDWTRLAPSIYASTSAPATWELKLWAALLYHDPSLAGGRSAAYLHGFEGVRASRPEILIPYGANSRSPLARVVRARHFAEVSSTTINGFRCTTVAETILTLSMTHPAGLIERFVDDRLAAGKLSIVDFHPILERLEFARQPGLRALRRTISARADDAYQPPTNELERLLYRLLDRDELPPYERQLPFKYPTTNATVDAYIGRWLLIVEGDGRRWHNRSADHDRDRLRDAEALAAGYAVLRLTWKMLKFEPEECLRRLLAIGQARSNPSVRR